jgi:hypothetical protein
MKRTLYSCLLLLSLVSGLAACTDHRTGQLTPERLRLKRTVSTLPGFPGTTVFNYDSQGRESSFTYEGYEGRFTYNEQNKVRLYNYVQLSNTNAAEQYSFNYPRPDSVIIYRYAAILNQGQYSPVVRQRDYYYNLNAAQQPIYVFDAAPGYGPEFHNATFTYTASNLTRQEAVSYARSPVYSADYQYDDRYNPYYGLIGPGITEQRRYSLNNIVKSTFTPDVRYPTANQTTEVASYEYNAQGYPTSATYPSGKLTFEYERY